MNARFASASLICLMVAGSANAEALVFNCLTWDNDKIPCNSGAGHYAIIATKDEVVSAIDASEQRTIGDIERVNASITAVRVDQQKLGGELNAMRSEIATMHATIDALRGELEQRRRSIICWRWKFWDCQ